jgi:NADH:quinone reductase (non-electrogenic)
MNQKHRIVIVGGGFAGLYAALELDKALPTRPEIEITLINKENFFLFTPMLHEVAAGDLDLTNIVNPVRKLLKNVAFFEGEVQEIDLVRRQVQVGHGFDGHSHTLEFDQIVLSIGSTTQFFGLPGVEEHALTMKSLSDAVKLRNRLIALLEAADTECSITERRELLSVAVAGAGFAGVETLASINDFLRNSLQFYPNLSSADLRLTLVHPGEVILPELSPKLGHYAQRKLEERGIEVMAHSRVTSYDSSTIELTDGKRLGARTLIWTAGTMPNPLISMLPCSIERGRVKVTAELAVPDWPGVWALGDCALVPDLTTGKFCPPTAQHALRQGKVVAQNIQAYVDGGEFKKFDFKTIGQLATIGHRAGVASIFGLNVSGFLAWWMWRTIYLSKLPRLEKKVRVALDWTLDLLFSKDLCQFIDIRPEHKITNEGLRHLQEHPHPQGATPEGSLAVSATL